MIYPARRLGLLPLVLSLLSSSVLAVVLSLIQLDWFLHFSSSRFPFRRVVHFETAGQRSFFTTRTFFILTYNFNRLLIFFLSSTNELGPSNFRFLEKTRR